MIFFGVDPGGTTGIARVDAFHKTIELMEMEHADVIRYFFEQIYLLHAVDWLAIEMYTITPRTHKLSRQNDALEIIGALKAICQVANCPEIVKMQTASAAKTAWSDERLKVHNLYGSPRMGHARDALRHALFALQRFSPTGPWEYQVR